MEYRIVSDYGYGDKTWLERCLSAEQVCNWFIISKNYDDNITLEDYPNDSDFTYYYEEDNENDVEDWNWQDS